MSIEQSAHVPPPNKFVTPGQDIGTKLSSDQYWKNKAMEARGMREYEEELKNIESIRNPQPAPEPLIKMAGSIDLGHIDFQEQARIARETEAAGRKAAEDRAERLSLENEKLKTDLLANTINSLQTNLGGQIQKLQADLATGRGNSKSIGDQLKEIIDSAALLGMVRPEAQNKTPVVQSTTDAAISLEIMRLQLDDKRKERDFAWTMEKDRRQFNLDLKKLEQANRLALAEMTAKKEQSAWISNMPAMIGDTIAKGLRSKPGNPIQRKAITRQAPRQAENIENEAPVSMSGEEENRKVTADIGETGTIGCPECGSPIAIGPTATQAVCAGCNYVVDIVRKGAPASGSIKGGERPDGY